MLLVPESLNQRLRDKGFSDKKNILIKEGYPLPKEIREADEWSEDDIWARTKKLAGDAYDKVWKI